MQLFLVCFALAAVNVFVKCLVDPLITYGASISNKLSRSRIVQYRSNSMMWWSSHQNFYQHKRLRLDGPFRHRTVPTIMQQEYITMQGMTALSDSDDKLIVSPFDESKGGVATTAHVSGSDRNDFDEDDGDELPLTRSNVERVLDEMRPYLQQDGGDVALAEIDGPVVRLELQGACGTCPSSSMTMKMGLERKLKERIPEIAEVVQSIPDAPDVSTEEVETVLDGVRPFLAVAGGKISVVEITGVGGLQPSVALRMEGSAAALQSVKIEIMQRLQRHFMQGLRIDWRD